MDRSAPKMLVPRAFSVTLSPKKHKEPREGVDLVICNLCDLIIIFHLSMVIYDEVFLVFELKYSTTSDNNFKASKLQDEREHLDPFPGRCRQDGVSFSCKIMSNETSRFVCTIIVQPLK